MNSNKIYGMENFDRKHHWETIYQTKSLEEVGWYQAIPEISLGLIAKLKLPKTAAIIDVGGGDSFLADKLLELGYTDITVLDISEKAIERAKARLGEAAENINWIVSDVIEFQPTRQYHLWHDRAAFHFLTHRLDAEKYVSIVANAVRAGGRLIVGAFSTKGSKMCSGIAIQQYDEATLVRTFSNYFKQMDFTYSDHVTPGGTIQHFIFGSFNRVNIP